MSAPTCMGAAHFGEFLCCWGHIPELSWCPRVYCQGTIIKTWTQSFIHGNASIVSTWHGSILDGLKTKPGEIEFGSRVVTPCLVAHSKQVHWEWACRNQLERQWKGERLDKSPFIFLFFLCWKGKTSNSKTSNRIDSVAFRCQHSYSMVVPIKHSW